MKAGVSLTLVFLTAVLTLAAPGDLDTTFGESGRIPQPDWAAKVSGAFGVAVQSDQKIVVAAVEGPFPNIPNELQGLLLARYRPDGSVDLTFGSSGKVFARISETCHSHGNDLALQPDGRIVITGRLEGCGSETGAYVMRFLPDGSLDSTFDGDGKLRIVSALTGFSTVSCKVAAQADGKLILSCSEWMWSKDFWRVVLRVNPNGSLDLTFGNSEIGGPGRVYLDATDFSPCDIAVQRDGKIIASSELPLTGGRSVLLIRLNIDGTVDASFGNAGWVVTTVSGFELEARALALQPDNKIVVVGSYQTTSASPLAIRYLPNGSLDTSFGGTGIIFFNRPSAYFSSVAVQRDGKILMASDSAYRMTRLLVSGALDPNFGNNGEVVTAFPTPTGNPIHANGGVADIAIHGNGKIVTVGYWQAYGSWPDVALEYRYPAIARYLGDAKARNDFDGDGRSDISVFRPSNSVWYLDRSTQGFFAVQFGLSTDKIVPADYDGDGKTDIAVFRDGTWWRIDSSTSTIVVVQFGTSGDVPSPGDYTGDGRDELAVYRNGQWWSLDLSNGQSSVLNFGLLTDKPVAADYDGDGRVDQAVYRNGEWHFNRSSLGYTVATFGLASDRPVVGDYDGDGRADLAVYRDGTWYLQQSTSGFGAFQWGVSTDTPAPGDYDGDGKTDAAVFRNGTWYLKRSASGVSIQQFGLQNDQPTAAAFLQ